MFDFLGVLTLVVLIVLFGFLAARAWRIKNTLLRWVGAGLAGALTLIVVGVLGLALRSYYLLNEQHNVPVAAVTVAGTPEQLARGEQLAHLCINCHSPNGELPLAGADFVTRFDMPPMGTLYAPNLTPGGDIDNWTDGEVIRAIREGVHRDGRSLLIMPSNIGRNYSDDDVQALVAYLRSQPPTGGPTPRNQLNLLGALFLNLADLRTVQAPVGNVTAPPTTDTLAYGKYMVDIVGCRDCHGEQLQGKVDTGQPGPPSGPNLTRIVPTWTEAEFMTFFNTGVMPNGATVPMEVLASGFSTPRMPWNEVRAATTDAELKAMYAYLSTLPPVEGP